MSLLNHHVPELWACDPRVSILVILDVALKPELCAGDRPGRIVSILVILDVALKPYGLCLLLGGGAVFQSLLSWMSLLNRSARRSSQRSTAFQSLLSWMSLLNAFSEVAAS